MTTDVNRIVNQQSMGSMIVGGYKYIDATNPRGGYQKPFVVNAQIPNHKDGHFVRPNMVAIKYPDFLKNADPNAHVKVFMNPKP
jgi:hypothetical protein